MPAPALATERPAPGLPTPDSATPCAAVLDRLLPLRAGSHRDAVALAVDVPLRYAECFAELAEGTRVRLRHRTQLLGWSGPEDRREFWFRAGEGLLRIRTAGRRVVELHVFAGYRSCTARSAADAGVQAPDGPMHRVIGIDGALLF
ncbi:MAG TPA: hypothetical protein VFY03_04755, partial [Woeseiaceae bacterium]|nr:hypothetical protein [Woeseiaceae bacterium]